MTDIKERRKVLLPLTYEQMGAFHIEQAIQNLDQAIDSLEAGIENDDEDATGKAVDALYDVYNNLASNTDLLLKFHLEGVGKSWGIHLQNPDIELQS